MLGAQTPFGFAEPRLEILAGWFRNSPRFPLLFSGFNRWWGLLGRGELRVLSCHSAQAAAVGDG